MTSLSALAGLSTVLAAHKVQAFTESLGGAAPQTLKDDAADRPFSVNGETFLDKGAAVLFTYCPYQCYK